MNLWVNSQIGENDRAPHKPMRLLGVGYNPVTDTFALKTLLFFRQQLKETFSNNTTPSMIILARSAIDD